MNCCYKFPPFGFESGFIQFVWLYSGMGFPEKTSLTCQSTGNKTEVENGQVLFAKNSKPN